MEPTNRFYIQSVNRALSIVEEVAKAGKRGILLTELSKVCGLPVSTAYRIVQNLLAWEYVTELDSGRFVLGNSIVRLGLIGYNSLNIKDIAEDYLVHLSDVCGETVYLAMYDRKQRDIFYVEKIRAKGAVQLSAEVGTRNFIHSTANGKVLMSGLSDEQIMHVLTYTGMPAATVNTITQLEQFLEEVRRVRVQGYAVDDEENELHVVCLASPISDRQGHVVASISISGVKDMAPLDREKKIELIKETANQISQAIMV